MKVKILTGIIIAAISVAAIMSTASRSENTIQTKEETLPKHEEVATKLTQKPPSVSESNQSTDSKTSLKELEGHINKEYGIREDILRYIEKKLPDNEMAKKAAIKYAQKWNFIYYRATKEEAMNAIKQQWMTLKCLRLALKTDAPMPITDGINKLMNNTPDRDKHIWNIDQSYFGWKAIGHDHINKEDIKKICEKGDY